MRAWPHTSLLGRRLRRGLPSRRDPFFRASGGARDVGSGGGTVVPTTDCSTHVSILMALCNDPGDQSAWAAFVDRYGPQIHAWCLRWRLQDADAQDVTQMVLLKLVRHLPDFAYDPSRSFRGWLRTLTAHSWSDFIRDQVRGVRGCGRSGRRRPARHGAGAGRPGPPPGGDLRPGAARAGDGRRPGAGRAAHLGGIPPDGHRGGRGGGGGGTPRHRRGDGLSGAATWCSRGCARPWPRWIPRRTRP